MRNWIIWNKIVFTFNYVYVQSVEAEEYNDCTSTEM